MDEIKDICLLNWFKGLYYEELKKVTADILNLKEEMLDIGEQESLVKLEQRKEEYRDILLRKVLEINNLTTELEKEKKKNG